MELTNIEKLLVKYENAETTLEEENSLRTYFSSNKVAPVSYTHLTLPTSDLV